MPVRPRAQALFEAALWVCAARAAWEAVRYFQGTRGRFHAESLLMILTAACVAWALCFPARSDSHRPAAAPEPIRKWLPALLTLAALLLYRPALGLGLLSDDYVLIERAATGAAFRPRAGEFYRPLPILVLGALGPWPWALHALNVLLHALNAVLVHRLALAVGATPLTAVASSLLFLSFPAGVEAVAWISGIQDVLLTTAGLSFVLVWGHASPWPLRLVASLLALICGLATKETAVVLPALALVTWLFKRGFPARDLWRLGAVSLVVTAVWAIARLRAAGLVEGYGGRLSRFVAKEMVVRSFGTLTAPWHDGLATDVLAILSALLWPALLVLSARAWRSDRASLGRALRMGLWFMLSVAPVYDYLYISPELGGSRYLYLAAAGGAILFVELITAACRSLSPTLLRAGLAAGVLVACGAVRVHLSPWQDAARTRDRTLAAAHLSLDELGCGTPSFVSLPDHVQGAYVFRNGFAEALRREGRLPSGTAPCRLVWDGERFSAR